MGIMMTCWQVKMELLPPTGVSDIDPCVCVSLSGADYCLVHRLSGPDLCLLPCLPGREGQQHRLQHLCRLPLVGDCEYYTMYTFFPAVHVVLANTDKDTLTYNQGREFNTNVVLL